MKNLSKKIKNEIPSRYLIYTENILKDSNKQFQYNSHKNNQ